MKVQNFSVAPRHDIHYKAPALRWDEGLPCGNGIIGMLVWGDGSPLNLSLDRSDLWDRREDPVTKRPDFNWSTLTGLLDRNDMKSVDEIFEAGSHPTAYPTKLPCGRLTLDFQERTAGNLGEFDSRLDLRRGGSTTRFGKTVVKAFVHAEQPLIIVRVRGGKPRVSFHSPFDPNANKNTEGSGGLDPVLLQYPRPKRGKRGNTSFVLQLGAEGRSHCVAWEISEVGEEWVLIGTVQQAFEGNDPVPIAIQTLRQARKLGLAQLEKSHAAWWRTYWRNGRIRLPEEEIEKLWYGEMYRLGACAREKAPPISLQSVWTADEMMLPPWRGDHHNDLNTELSYWPVHTAGRLEQSLGFSKWLHQLLPQARAFAREFYDAPGANLPCSHGPDGQIVRGWAAYMYSRTNTAWLLQHLWWHYRYTMDADFLRDIAYPFIREVVCFVVSQLSCGEDGIYHIEYSSSPEYFDNTRESFGSDSTHDLSLIRHALKISSASARALGVDAAEADHWDHVRAHLHPYHLSPPSGHLFAPAPGLAIWKGQRLTESHRHLSQCMPIFPLGDLNVEGSTRDRELIQNTLAELEMMGTGLWCGYSFAWLACIGARIREPNRAIWALRSFLDAFVSPNGFHLNGDFKKSGISRFHYRPFTLEGNFAAAHAVNEILLQSWGDRIRIFPAVPGEWRDVSFIDLRAEGAFVVSAWRRNGEFFRASIRSEKGMKVRLEHPCPNRNVVLRSGKSKMGRGFCPGDDICFETRIGETYVLKVEERKRAI